MFQAHPYTIHKVIFLGIYFGYSYYTYYASTYQMNRIIQKLAFSTKDCIHISGLLVVVVNFIYLLS